MNKKTEEVNGIKYQVEEVNGIKYQYSSDWLKELESEFHWRLYWYQQKMIQSYLNFQDNILEIGVGTSFTANYLKSKGFAVTTFDIDKEKKPDIVGNIVEQDWKGLKFSHILAFEVFEHIPFEEFKKSLKKLHSVCEKKIFISLPINKITLFEIEYKLPKIRRNTLRIALSKNKITTPAHFWEVGYDKYSEIFIENMFAEQGFKLTEKSKKSSFIYYVLEKNE